MINDVYSLLLDQRIDTLSDKAVESGLSKVERAELRALQLHQDKPPAVVHRIRILTAKLAQPNRWRMLWMRFCKKFRSNLAELEALVHYGHSRAVWEIAYLSRKKAVSRLSALESRELETLILYHDSPAVLRITTLKLKEDFQQLTDLEQRELINLQRNLYRQDGAPEQLLALLWPEDPPTAPKQLG